MASSQIPISRSLLTGSAGSMTQFESCCARTSHPRGLNLHFFCRRLGPFALPGSLMVFQQRNGRVDRYSQKHRPEIIYLFTESPSLLKHHWNGPPTTINRHPRIFAAFAGARNLTTCEISVAPT